jgi:hypothetical protein
MNPLKRMPHGLRITDNYVNYVNEEPRTLLPRTFYKRFGDFDRDFEYTYSAEQIGCQAAGQPAHPSARQISGSSYWYW